MTPRRLTAVYAGGTWFESSSRSTVPVINPATEEPSAEVTEGTAADAERAAAAARQAFPSWSATPPAERAAGDHLSGASAPLNRRGRSRRKAARRPRPFGGALES